MPYHLVVRDVGGVTLGRVGARSILHWHPFQSDGHVGWEQRLHETTLVSERERTLTDD
jgi:hypothetical protein